MSQEDIDRLRAMVDGDGTRTRRLRVLAEHVCVCAAHFLEASIVMAELQTQVEVILREAADEMDRLRAENEDLRTMLLDQTVTKESQE